MQRGDERGMLAGRPWWSKMAAGLGLAGLVMILAYGGFMGASAAPVGLSAPTPTPVSVTLDPPQALLVPTEKVTLTVRVGAVQGLAGEQLALRFDPAVLEVVDAIPTMNGVQIIPAEIFQRYGRIEGANSADNVTGVITYACALLGNNTVAGPGVLGQIVFRAKAFGASAVTFDVAQSSLARVPTYEQPELYFNATWSGATVTVGALPFRAYLPLTLRSYQEP
jgi:hypothetical protein